MKDTRTVPEPDLSAFLFRRRSGCSSAFAGGLPTGAVTCDCTEPRCAATPTAPDTTSPGTRPRGMGMTPGAAYARGHV